MINIGLHLTNPFVRPKFNNLFCKFWQVAKNKIVEFEVLHDNQLLLVFDFSIVCKVTGAHSGFRFEFGLYKYSLSFNFYDSRHY